MTFRDAFAAFDAHIVCRQRFAARSLTKCTFQQTLPISFVRRARDRALRDNRCRLSATDCDGSRQRRRGAVHRSRSKSCAASLRELGGLQRLRAPHDIGDRHAQRRILALDLHRVDDDQIAEPLLQARLEPGTASRRRARGCSAQTRVESNRSRRSGDSRVRPAR